MRIAQLAAAREGPSPAKELTTAQAEETASLGLGSAAILYARCTPDPGGGGVVRETRRAGERGDARAFEYALRCRLARRGRQRRYGGAARREGAREGRWSLPGGACGRRDVGLGVVSSE